MLTLGCCNLFQVPASFTDTIQHVIYLSRALQQGHWEQVTHTDMQDGMCGLKLMDFMELLYQEVSGFMSPQATPCDAGHTDASGVTTQHM